LASSWDDDFPGLKATLEGEAEWKHQDDHNEAVAASWAVEAPDGWGNTQPMSPVEEEGVWPGTQPKDQCYPRVSVGPDAWPSLDAVQVTMTITEKVEEGHTACRFSVLVGLSVPDLLSFLCHSTIGTSA
jgi:hypothetical protein